jgi:two-component system sensor histidine kinase FlrB
MSMAQQNTVKREQLEDAFQVFNQVSGQLVDSYHQLQAQVARLTAELSASRSERLKQLAEKESLANRLTRLLETLPAAVVVLDGQGVVNQLNPAAEEMLPGITLGAVWHTLYHQCFRPGQQESEQWLVTGRLVTLTQRSLEPDSGHIILLLDVTETRQLQERIARRKRLSVMGEMSAQLAHQIRTPLSSALIDTTLLSREDLTLQQRERFSQRCLERLRHIESQINDMLAFAKGGKFELAKISIQALMDDLRQAVEPLCQENAATLNIQSESAEMLFISGNQDALLGAMINIAFNAIQQQGPIHLQITLKRENDLLTITFSDNGPGISEAHQQHIFDPFYTTRSNGTGLGLAVVQAVVLAHHGKVTVESQSGIGARFSIVLPLFSELSVQTPVAAAVAQDSEYTSVVRSSA